MRDSLISGQPLYLLYSKSAPSVLPASRAATLAVQATGSVRLQVTGRPPTTSVSAPSAAFLSPSPFLQAASGSTAAPAAARQRKSRRPRRSGSFQLIVIDLVGRNATEEGYLSPYIPPGPVGSTG